MCWQPEFFIEHNYLKEFERRPTKEYSCEIWQKSSQWFLRSFFKMDGRTTDTMA